MAVALGDGRAVALKIADGSNRARVPVMIAALTALGVDVSMLDAAAATSSVYGHGKPVGRVHVVGKLAALSTTT